MKSTPWVRQRQAGAVLAVGAAASLLCIAIAPASASGAKTVGLFTETHPADWGPYGPNDCSINARERTPEDVAGDVIDKNPLLRPR